MLITCSIACVSLDVLMCVYYMLARMHDAGHKVKHACCNYMQVCAASKVYMQPCIITIVFE